jgi:exodeoxyribonuclease VII large subunit
MKPAAASTERRVLTVSDLTARVKSLVEDAFPFLWVTGEISNLRVPASGHFYFTLKDASAQLRSVMFRGHSRVLAFTPENGMAVLCLGRLAVYEPQGLYQLLVEHLEPAGIGTLQLAFEQLKAKLQNEGLFDPKLKRPLPFLPRKIQVITSPTGAVIRDILSVLSRRFPGLPTELIPVRVQGAEAVEDIVRAFALAARDGSADVVVLARGGGSLEDLAAFNSEPVARAIRACPVPVVSAVGHETDTTIADFAADVRAPTPSAAAELVAPEKAALRAANSGLFRRLCAAMSGRAAWHRARAEDLGSRLVHPKRRVEDARLRLDDLTERLCATMSRRVLQSRALANGLGSRLVHPKRRTVEARLRLDELCARLTETMNRTLRARQEHARRLAERLITSNPPGLYKEARVEARLWNGRLYAAMDARIEKERAGLAARAGTLQALSPLAVLARGYGIARLVTAGKRRPVIRDAAAVPLGARIEILLHKGQLDCVVEERHTDEEDSV